MGITAKELAEKLNLSAAAVSMALNNKPGVSTETRRRILNAAEKNDYDFSRHSIRNQGTGSIYFIIYKKHGTIVGNNPFFEELSEGIAAGCKEHKFKMEIRYLYGDEERLEDYLEAIHYSDCIGMILLATEMTIEDLRLFKHLSIPIVLLDSYFETAPYDCIVINNMQGAYLATRHLIKMRHTQPGYLCSAYSISNFGERNFGFFKAIRAHGMAFANSIVHSLPPSIDGAYAEMLEIIKRKEPLASCYFADNDLIAIGVIKALKQSGYQVPEDIAIVGFDNIPASEILEPALSTIHVPKHYMGKMAAKQLFSRILEPSATTLKLEISTTLIRRNSV